jgi:hypothetical protein
MTTNLTTASAEQLQALQLAQSAPDCTAVLPYWPIWAAAQFASTDEAKHLLQFVHVWQDGDVLQIESTDGHRAFRYRLPAWSTETYGNGAATAQLPTLWRVPAQGLLLHAKALRKAVSYAKLLTVTHGMRAVFHGGKKEALTELSSVNLAGHYSVNTADDCGKVGTYPNINQLWPDKFSCEPGKPWAFNATYLKEWCAVVEKLSHNGVTRTQGNSATTPFTFNCSYVPRIGQHAKEPELELLLMPVQIRL